MAFTKYLVIGAVVGIQKGQLVKDLDEDQFRRRKSLVSEVKGKKGVYQCEIPFCFKAGEVVTLESEAVNKALLKVLHEPSKIEIVRENEDVETILDIMTKKQLIAFSEANKKCKSLKLDMEMVRDKMLEQIYQCLGIKKKAEDPEEKKDDEAPSEEEESKTGKAPV